MFANRLFQILVDCIIAAGAGYALGFAAGWDPVYVAWAFAMWRLSIQSYRS